jgi:hypothetical protein
MQDGVCVSLKCRLMCYVIRGRSVSPCVEFRFAFRNTLLSIALFSLPLSLCSRTLLEGHLGTKIARTRARAPFAPCSALERFVGLVCGTFLAPRNSA